MIVRRLRAVWFAIGATWIALAILVGRSPGPVARAANPAEQVLVVNGLRIVDVDGHPLAELVPDDRTAKFVMFDREGRARIRISIPEGGPRIDVLDPDGKRHVEIAGDHLGTEGGTIAVIGASPGEMSFVTPHGPMVARSGSMFGYEVAGPVAGPAAKPP